MSRLIEVRRRQLQRNIDTARDELAAGKVEDALLHTIGAVIMLKNELDDADQRLRRPALSLYERLAGRFLVRCHMKQDKHW